jgi:hypothetical protein
MPDRDRYRRELAALERDSDSWLLIALVVIITVVIGLLLFVHWLMSDGVGYA